MKSSFKTLLLSIGIFASLIIGASSASAADVVVPTIDVSKECSTTGASDSTVCQNSGAVVDSTLQKVVDTLLIFLGVVALVVIIIGGLRYITSAGDSKSASQARSSIIYAIVGLVVAFLAYAIVHWVLGRKL